MDFDLTEDQQEIKRTARDLLAARSPWARCARRPRRGALRRRAVGASSCELGWPGIAVAEEHGGQGLGAVELAVLLEELGYACAATPFLSTAAAAAVDPGRAARDEQRARWLPGLASGEPTARDRHARELVRRRRRRRGDRARRRRRRRELLDRRRRRRRAGRRRSTRRAATRTRRAATASRSAAARARPRSTARRSPPRSSASASARST